MSGVNDKINCYNCNKHPLCYVYNDIYKVLDKTPILRSSNQIFYAIANECKYYKKEYNL